jgi:subtilisin-like proprotein convertase family protein
MNPQTLIGRATVAMATVALLAGLSNAQTLGCTTGGPGGSIPTSGTGGGGVYPTALPPFELALPLSVASTPPGSTVVTEVRLNGLTHTFAGDLQFVLTAPNGARHNIANRNSGGCDYGGDYVIVAECTTGVVFGTCASSVPPGTYSQFFGGWPSGTNSIDNTPLSSIAAASGTWTLTIYDWAGADIGFITSWGICFGTPPTPTAPAGTPLLVSPANGATVSNPITLTWDPVACATTYDVDLDGVVTTGIASTSFAAPPLATGGHTWTVRAVNSAGTGAYTTPSTFNVPTPPPPSTCVGSGVGGLIPTSGTGDGTWPTAAPTAPLISSYVVNPPAGASQIVKVQLTGLTHTWIGDLHIVLTAPNGTQYNVLHRPGFLAACCGLNCDMNGDYAIYEASGQDMALSCSGGFMPSGDYVQDFGSWVSGDLGINNVPLGSIPVAAGNWTLSIYDWAAGDTGGLSSWSLCFAAPAGPTTFCTPIGTGTSSGCIPTIAATGSPNVSHTAPCVVTVSSVEGQKTGLLFYGINGQINFPWCVANSNSFLCVKAPTQRLFPQQTGGTAGQCNGQLTNNWNTFQTSFPGSLGQPFSAGDVVDMQGWFRDPPSCKTTFLSEGLRLTYQP